MNNALDRFISGLNRAEERIKELKDKVNKNVPNWNKEKKD